jgi:AcrR family transcriptional regulator
MLTPETGETTAAPARKRRTQEERSEETKRRILQAATRLTVRNGYAALRTADVAQEAGVSKGALQHHFPTKEALVIALIEHAFNDQMLASRQRAAQRGSQQDLIETVIDDAKEFFFSEYFLIAVNLVLSSQPPSEIRTAVLAISQRARLPVEAAWKQAFIAAGIPEDIALELLTLTLAIVRGYSVRNLWDDNAEWRNRCFAVWADMVRLYAAKHRQNGKANASG